MFKRKQRETGDQEEAGEYATFSAFGCFVSLNCPWCSSCSTAFEREGSKTEVSSLLINVP